MIGSTSSKWRAMDALSAERYGAQSYPVSITLQVAQLAVDRSRRYDGHLRPPGRWPFRWPAGGFEVAGRWLRGGRQVAGSWQKS